MREYILNNKIDLDKYNFENQQIFYLKAIQHLVDNKIPIARSELNDVNKCISFLESQNINVDFDNLLSIIINVKINLLPNDFNCDGYKKHNKDLSDLNMNFKELIEHYIRAGKEEERRYN